MIAPDPAEVRQRSGPCHAKTPAGECGHSKAVHGRDVIHDGHCRIERCGCVGWDPMTDDEWKAVLRR